MTFIMVFLSLILLIITVLASIREWGPFPWLLWVLAGLTFLVLVDSKAVTWWWVLFLYTFIAMPSSLMAWYGRKGYKATVKFFEDFFENLDNSVKYIKEWNQDE